MKTFKYPNCIIHFWLTSLKAYLILPHHASPSPLITTTTTHHHCFQRQRITYFKAIGTDSVYVGLLSPPMGYLLLHQKCNWFFCRHNLPSKFIVIFYEPTDQIGLALEEFLRRQMRFQLHHNKSYHFLMTLFTADNPIMTHSSH